MIENHGLGIKVAENTDESFWTETKEKCEEAIKSENRNIEINKVLIKLCEKQLS